MSNNPNATRTKEITATAGMNWIADLLAYLDHTATNSIDGESTATILQLYDYSRNEFRAEPKRLWVGLKIDSLGRKYFSLNGQYMAYAKWWKKITN